MSVKGYQDGDLTSLTVLPKMTRAGARFCLRRQHILSIGCWVHFFNTTIDVSRSCDQFDRCLSMSQALNVILIISIDIYIFVHNKRKFELF